MATPMKPTMIAAQRRGPIHSPSIGPASRATRKGVAKMIEVVWSSWRERNANRLKAVDKSSRVERPICSQGRLVESSPGVVHGLTNRSDSTKWLA